MTTQRFRELSTTNQMTLGFERKRIGQHVVREHNEEWVGLGVAFVEALESGVAVDAELIRGWIGDPPGHANALGALVSALIKLDLIRKTGWRTTTRPERHHAVIRTYVKT